jgi:hypothetical protein
LQATWYEHAPSQTGRLRYLALSETVKTDRRTLHFATQTPASKSPSGTICRFFSAIFVFLFRSVSASFLKIIKSLCVTA